MVIFDPATGDRDVLTVGIGPNGAVFNLQ